MCASRYRHSRCAPPGPRRRPRRVTSGLVESAARGRRPVRRADFGPSTSTSRYAGCAPGTGPPGRSPPGPASSPSASTSSAAVSWRREPVAQCGQDRQRRGDAGDPDQRDGRGSAASGTSRSRSLGQHAERALAADEQLLEVVPGVVLGRAVEPADHATPSARTASSPATWAAHRAVPHDPLAAGVRRDHAADGGGARASPGRRRGPSRAGGRGPAPTPGWRRPRRAPTPCRPWTRRRRRRPCGAVLSSDLATGRDAAADQAGVAALHHDRRRPAVAQTPSTVAPTWSVSAGRTTGRGPAVEPPGPVGLVRRGESGSVSTWASPTARRRSASTGRTAARPDRVHRRMMPCSGGRRVCSAMSAERRWQGIRRPD